jgi:hypothetical protein
MAAAALLATSSAFGRDVDYHAAEGCPTRAEVSAWIAEQPGEPERGRAARIEILPTGGSFRGSVVVGEGALQQSRSVEARTCSAVVEALLLVVALDREEEQETQASTGPAQDRASQPTAPQPAATPIADAPASANRDAAIDVRKSTHDERGDLAGVFGSTFAASAFARAELLFGTSLFAELDALNGVAGFSWLRPSVRGAFVRRRSTPWTESGGVEPDFIVTGGILDGCLASPWRSTSFTLFACSTTEIASLSASAAGVDTSAQSRWWLATGAVGRARFVFPVHGSVRPMIELSAGALAPLRRDRFHFEGHDAVAASPWLWTASIGGGIELR